MALPFDHAGMPGDDVAGPQPLSGDPRALRILAKTIYRELRQSGLLERDVMALAGELLGLVACDVKDQRDRALADDRPSSTPPAVR